MILLYIHFIIIFIIIIIIIIVKDGNPSAQTDFQGAIGMYIAKGHQLQNRPTLEQSLALE